MKTKNMISKRFADLRSDQGSAFITAVIFAGIIAITAGSYLYLAGAEYRISMRSFLFGSSFALAEGGVDQAIDSLNDKDSTGWSKSSDEWRRSFTSDLNIGGGVTGKINVVVVDASTTQPVVFAEGRSIGHPVGDVVKQLRAELNKGFTLGDAGFVADLITLNGNTIRIAAFHSAFGAPKDSIPDGSKLPWDDSVTMPNGSRNFFDIIKVASASITGDIDVGNADIFGYVTVSPSGKVTIGKQGKVSATPGDYDETAGVHDASRITYDFYSDFPVMAVPNEFWYAWSAPAPVNDQIILDGSVNPTMKLSGDYSLANKYDLVVKDDIVLYVPDGHELSFGGNLTIENGASLTIYTDGDVTVHGDVNNSNTAVNFSIIGTAEEPANPKDRQQIDLKGNGNLNAFIYAPNANVKFGGGGGKTDGFFQGAVVAAEATLTGNWQFWFDRALGDIEWGPDDYEVESWVDVSAMPTVTASSGAIGKIDMSQHGL